jgi:glutaminyl-peptide cyclotransferase
MRNPTLVLLAALLLSACGPNPDAPTPEYYYDVVRTYPHDREAFTEGLFFLDGFLYESTGLEGHSSIRKVRLETGEIVQQHEVPAYFGEGIVNWKDRLVELTYKTRVGFVYDLSTLAVRKQFDYPGEGWALTQDGKRIIMSDGTPQLRFWNPDTLAEEGRVTVNDKGVPVNNVNELEYIKGEVWANIWMVDRIARIDPATGNVTGWIDLTGILPKSDQIEGQTDVLNGIAYDAQGDRIFVTGKRWPKLFEIKIVKKQG